MSVGNFWPSMYCNVDLWKGREPGSFSGVDNTSNVYSSTFNWTNRGVRRNYATGCREIMSNDLRKSADEWGVIFKDKFDPAIEKRVTLTINKNPPSNEWLSLWRSAYAFPNLIKSYSSSDGHMNFVLDNKFFAMGAPQPVFSMTFFFLNRYEAFPIEMLANPRKVISFLLDSDEQMWQGSARHGPMAFAHAFAVHVRVMNGDLNAFHKLIACNGVGQYVYRELVMSNARDLVEFVKEYHVDVNQYTTEAYTGAALSVGQIINAVRASNHVSNPASW